jgi:beta-carotene 15,15'-dioxygenase
LAFEWRPGTGGRRLSPVVVTDAAPSTRIVTVSKATIVLNIGLITAGLAVALSLVSDTTSTSTEIGPVPIALTLLALLVGIPHGAVDHLTLARRLTLRERLVGAAAYLALAAGAAAAILVWPGATFLAVIAMTVWHFGTGDVEATRELEHRPPITGAGRIAYAIALGSAPVLLPLTSPAAVATLTAIEPQLATVMSPSVASGVRYAVVLLIVLCLLWLIQRGDLRGALELGALAILGLVAAPLIAFAVYFGFWHALRHTARLAEATQGTITLKSMVRVTRAGLPSVVGFVAVVVALMAFTDPAQVVGPALWFGLAVIWGLTVPHMLLVARFDSRMRRRRHQSVRDSSESPVLQQRDRLTT